jgi:multiple sugar transport system ATP-binding protein
MADRISVMHQGNIVQAASPIEVYRNPAARFVASFIGNPPMNFLTASQAGQGKWQVAGQTFAGPNTDKAGLLFAIRPEDMQPAEQGLRATAKIVEPLGAHLLVTCQIDDALFRVVLDSDTVVKAGETLTLAPQPDRVRWFDPETTLAVA